MANTVIELRHSRATGNVPTSLANGELAINTYDGKLFYRGGVSNTIQTITRFTGPAGLDTEVQFNDSGSLGSSGKLTFNKTTGLLTVNGTVRANIFSDDGVDLYDFSNNAFNTANAAFSAANTAQSTATSAQNTADAAFIKANTGTTGANSFGVIYTANNNTYANAATANAQLNFVGESGVIAYANSITKTITIAGTPGAQGLTVDYGFVSEAIFYSIDYGTL